MKKLITFFVAAIIAYQCTAQINTTTRLIKFRAGVQSSSDTTETSGNEGNIWYDFVTGKFRYNQGGTNSTFGSGGGGAFWKTAGTTLLTDVSEVRMENQPNRSISLTANNPTRGHIKIGTGLTTGGNTFIDLTANIGSTGGKILLDNQNIVGEGAGLWVTDGLGVGLQYVSDYSANFSDRSLADWGNVWKVKGDTNLSGDVQIISDPGFSVNLMADASNFIATGLSGGVNNSAVPFYLSANGSSSFSNDQVQFLFDMGNQLGYGSGVWFVDNRNVKKGVEYGGDYSASFTARSIVDKAYVQNLTLEGSASLNFPAVLTNTVQTLTMTVTGAVDGDPVSLGVPAAAVINNLTYFAWVSSANTVSVRAVNVGGASSDPPAATFTVTLHKP